MPGFPSNQDIFYNDSVIPDERECAPVGLVSGTVSSGIR
jgi:hypothetical protein